ncbi:MAG: L-threonine 3-dehydrogenase [Candidatus Melainabacteria bacterium HGW-Melainabacteria-1]|nr:MAG: L-threonine 3-dehydrogenase [Candidatus Melainabacteria bacterium HGW-Melainabacteria-1]
MKALVKEGKYVQLQELTVPVAGAGEVLIRVRAAGLCRTDLLVIQGRLPAIDPLIPGHELAGEVAGIGKGVKGFERGEPVTVHPMLGCGSCAACGRRQPEHCPTVRVLGIEHHGAFGEYLCVPARALWKLPCGLSWQTGAYAEPVAAALGVLRADIKPEQEGAICGHNRIAELTGRILSRHGHQFQHCQAAELMPNSLDYLIETGLSAAELPMLLGALKPGGTLVAKSRHIDSLALPWQMIVRKDIRVQGAYYGDFGEAVALLGAAPELLSGLIGPAFELADWERFLAPDDERGKRFLVLD